jgi:hypothetical protein
MDKSFLASFSRSFSSWDLLLDIMKQIAVDKARSRLQKATESYRRLRESETHDDFSSAWTDLLLALNAVYSALEQGAKDNPRSRQWYGNEKRKRREDPLLQYLHQARNADEHGLAPVTKLHPGHIRTGQTVTPTNRLSISLSLEEVRALGGKRLELKAAGESLVTVVNTKFGDKFDPPLEHLGRPLLNTSPIGIAMVGLAYHAQMIEEAEKLV